MQISELELLKAPLTITPVTSQDPDDGPNHLQNFPVINFSKSVINPALVKATGTLASEANTDYLIEVFGDDAANAVCVGLLDPVISLVGNADVYNIAEPDGGKVDYIADAKAAVDAGKASTSYHNTVDSIAINETGTSAANCCNRPFDNDSLLARAFPIGVADNFSTGVFGQFHVAADANHNGVSGESILFTFGLFTDDSSQLIIKGTNGFIDIGGDSQGEIRTVYTNNDALTADFLTGNSNVYGTIMLTEGQNYDFEIYQLEAGGGSAVVIGAAKGNAINNAGAMSPISAQGILDAWIAPYLYTSDVCGPQSFLSAQGKYLLGSFMVHTDSMGKADFSVLLKDYVPAGQLMTTTASKIDEGVPVETSQFSEAADVHGGGSDTAYASASGAAGGS